MAKIYSCLTFVLFLLLFLSSELSSAEKYVGRTRPGSLSSRTTVIYNWASGFIFDFGLYYGQSSAVASPVASNEWSQTIMLYDIKMGYVTDSGFYLGGEYSGRNETNASGGTGNGGTPAVGVGYFFGNGFSLRGFYRWNETWGGYKDGTGYQIDFGYMTAVTSDFYLGIQLSRRETTFKTHDTIAGFNSWRRTETYPMLSFGFLIN